MPLPNGLTEARDIRVISETKLVVTISISKKGLHYVSETKMDKILIFERFVIPTAALDHSSLTHIFNKIAGQYDKP